MGDYKYKCLGCGKELNTSTEYEYGWICTNCRSTIKLMIPCSVCGKLFEVKWDTYGIRKRNNDDRPWRCRRCNDDYRNAIYDSKSDEEKAAFVASQAARSKAYWKNLDLGAKYRDSKRRKKLWDERKANGDMHIIEAMKRGRKKWWNSLTEEERRHQWDYMNDGRDEWWRSLSDEDREKYIGIYRDATIRRWSKLSPEEREIQMQGIRAGNRKFWDELIHDPEKYTKWKLGMMAGYTDYLDTINRDPNKNETAFIDLLRLHDIQFSFQYQNKTIHPDFTKLFPNNPVTGATLVDPIHPWDFCIHTLDGDVLVDVDGSMHFKDTYTRMHPYSHKIYRELDYKKFLDSQRPYQTDGLPAYAVLCYDDNLTTNTKVINIATGEKSRVDTLISMLLWMNTPEDQKREILSNHFRK